MNFNPALLFRNLPGIPHKRRAVLAGVSLCLAMAFCCGLSKAQEEGAPTVPLSAAHLLPEETYFLATFSGVDRLLTKAESLDLVRLFKDPEVQAFLADTLEMLPQLVGGEGSIPLPLDEIWALCRGEVTLACSNTLPVFMGGAPPSVALFVEMGEGKEAFAKRFDSLLERIVWAKSFQLSEKEHRGVGLRSLVPPQAGGAAIHFAAIESFFVVSFDCAFIEGMIDRFVDRTPGLAGHGAFRRCQVRGGGADSDLFVFVNVVGFKELFQPFYPYDLDEWISVLGLEQMEALSLSSLVAGGGSRDILFVDCAGEKKGLLKALSPQPLSERVLLQAPPDTLFLLAATLDASMVLDQVDTFLRTALPEFHGFFRSDLDGFKASTGLDLEREILAPIGSELALFITSPQGGFAMIPNFYLTLSLDDEAAFRETEQKLFALLPDSIEVTQSTFNERIIHHLTIPGSMLSPAFCVFDDQMIMASSPMAMKSYIRWLAKEEPGLSQTPAFGLGVAGTPESASMLFFINTRKSVEIGYGMGAAFLPNLLSGLDVPLDAGLLPMGESLTQYFSSASTYLVSDDTGLILSGRNPLGVGAMAAMFVSFFDYLVTNDLTRVLAETASSVVSPGSVAPQQQDADLGAAYTQMQSGAWSVAEVRLSAWIDAHPDQGFATTWALRHRGDCYFQLQRYSDAIADYRAVAERDANARGLVYSDIARVYTLMNEPDQAISFLEKAITAGCVDFENDPVLAALQDHARLDVFVGMVMTTSEFMMEGRYAEAEEIFTHWLLNNQFHALEAWALKNRGNCYLKLDRCSDAIADFEKAARKEKSYSPRLYYSIACLHSSVLNETDETVQYLKMAIDAGFDDFELMGYDADLDTVRDDPRFEALSWGW